MVTATRRSVIFRHAHELPGKGTTVVRLPQQGGPKASAGADSELRDREITCFAVSPDSSCVVVGTSDGVLLGLPFK